MNYLKRHLPLAGYLVLAIATGYTFNVERQHSNDNKLRAVENVATVLKNNCESGNELRIALVQILTSGIKQIQILEKTGQIPHTQAVRQIRFQREAIAKLQPVNCEARIAPLIAEARRH